MHSIDLIISFVRSARSFSVIGSQKLLDLDFSTIFLESSEQIFIVEPRSLNLPNGITIS